MRPNRISTAMEYRLSPWTFSAIVTVAVAIFMVSVSFLLFVLLAKHPDPAVRAALAASVASALIASVVLIGNSVLQARTVRSLVQRLHASQHRAAEPAHLPQLRRAV